AAVPALAAQFVEGVAAQKGPHRRRQHRRRALAEQPGRRVAPLRPLAQPPEAEGVPAVRHRRRLDLPGTGGVGLGGGGRFVFLLEPPQELLGEGVAERRSGTILGITHGGSPVRGWGPGTSDRSSGPLFFPAGGTSR